MGPLPSRARDRVSNALTLHDEMVQLARAMPTVGTLHLLWGLTRGSLASALTFDAGLCSGEPIEEAAGKVATAVRAFCGYHSWR